MFNQILNTQLKKTLTKHKDFLKMQITYEIVKRYHYEEGVFIYKMNNDNTISEAIKILLNYPKYKSILSTNK